MSNFNNNRWLSIATLVLLIANIVTLTLLWTHKKNEGAEKRLPPPAPVFEFLTKELQLNEQQQAAYKQLRDQHQAEQKQFQDSIHKAKDALFSLLKKPNVPDSLLQDYSKKATAFEQQLDIITFRHFQKLRALCNEIQQKKFDDIIKEVLRIMAGPRGRPPAGPGNPPPPGIENEPESPQQ